MQRCFALHQPTQGAGRLTSDPGARDLDAGECRCGEHALEFVVVHGEDGEILGDPEIQLSTCIDHHSCREVV